MLETAVCTVQCTCGMKAACIMSKGYNAEPWLVHVCLQAISAHLLFRESLMSVVRPKAGWAV